jgi:tricorn protease
MNKAKIFLVFLFAALQVTAQKTPLWLRYPAISPDGKNIVFSFKGDLYKVASAGGIAYPLTLHEAHDFMPVWSHDGKKIALQATGLATLTCL